MGVSVDTVIMTTGDRLMYDAKRAGGDGATA
jgi:hypothetical protein